MKRADLDAAAAVLRAGGIVAYPTESCYGLGCDPDNHRAVRRLLHLKRRNWRQGLILIADHPARLARYLAPLSAGAQARVGASWPGPFTWLVPARARVSPWLRGDHDSLAVRVTAHRGAATLCRGARRAIVSTSANRHGRPPALSAEAVRREFGDALDFVLVGILGGAPRPTQIRDAETGALVRA